MGMSPHMTPEEFRALGRRMVDWIADYWDRVGDLPVLSQARPGEIAARLPEHPPERGLPDWDEIFQDVEKVVLPGMTHWQSPGFFAFFPCNASFPAILGEMLSAGFNINGMLWATSPAATELETRVLDWTGEMIGLPACFRSTGAGGGIIQGTASESTLIAMVAARRRVAGTGELVAYASTQAHSSVMKAAMIAGVARGPEDHAHVRLIETDSTYALRPDSLERAMREDQAAGRIPFFVCATVGTTASTAVDPVDGIAAAVASCGAPAWVHVDAALAGCACVCPEFRWMLKGAEHADSVCFNPHKWLLTNFDCDCFFVRDRAALVSALSVAPEYLRTQASQSGQVFDYRDWQIPLGRRFRALKLWFVIRHYGVEGLRAYIREHVRLAALLEDWIRSDPRFELAAPRTINLVCFRLRGAGPDADARNRTLLERINATGRAYLSHAVLSGRHVLRIAVGATQTQERHVRDTWDLVRELAEGV